MLATLTRKNIGLAVSVGQGRLFRGTELTVGILRCPCVTQVWGQLPPLQEVGLFIPVSLYSDTPLFGYYSGIWAVELFAPSHHPRPLLLAELQPVLQLVCVGRSRSELCGGTAQIFGSCGVAKSWRSSVHHQCLLGTLWGISEWRLKNLSSSYILILDLLCAPQRRPFRGSEAQSRAEKVPGARECQDTLDKGLELAGQCL